MNPDDPRHGSYAGWQAHERSGAPLCEPCRKARNRYNKGLGVDHARGIKRRVSPAKTTRHVKRLHNAGLSYPEIARRAGVSKGTVYRVAGQGYDTPLKMEAAKLARILAVTVSGGVAAVGYVPRVGVARRVRALSAIGWTRAELAERLGMSSQNLTQLVNGCRGMDVRPNEWVQATTWHKVADLYDELHMKPGPSESGRRRAAAKGWPPPMAWDEGAIDDPTARPYRGTWYERNTTKRPRGSLLENWAWMRAGGTSIEEAARRLGVTTDAIEKAVERAAKEAAA